MRRLRRIRRLLAVPLCSTLGLAGCSQTSNLQARPGAGFKTVATVGDQTQVVATGEPGDSTIRSDVSPSAGPRTPGAPATRISGRVYGEDGRPVPGARVRFAIGGVAGGRDVSATTDRSGAFTLHGMKPGTYTLIAETDDADGPRIGRVEASAPERNVEISLQSRSTGRDRFRTAKGGVAPQIGPISDIGESEEDSEDASYHRRSKPSGVNEEDLGGPAEAAESLGDSRGRRSAEVSLTENRPASRGSWTRNGSEPAAEPSPSRVDEEERRPAPAPSHSMPAQVQAYDEGPNPLPPAMEAPSRSDRESDGSSPYEDSESDSFRDDDQASRGGFRTEIVTDLDLGSDNPPSEMPLPSKPSRDRSDPGLTVASAEVGEAPEDLFQLAESSPEPTVETAVSKAQIPASNERVAVAHGPLDSGPGPDNSSTPTDLARPSWGDIVSDQEVPLDEGLRKRQAALQRAAASREGETVAEPTRKTRFGLLGGTAVAAATVPAKPVEVKPFCDYDPANRRLRDFVLPDVEGRPVAFRDLGADLVLLDFWGTWCAPCKESIPHLTEIQERYKDKKFVIVGIACERTEPKERAAKVAETMKEMNINYPVLLTAMDGTCPLQEALKIQFYPTMVLLDREGRVLWRDQGATGVTLARLDRFISSALKRARHGKRELASGLWTMPVPVAHARLVWKRGCSSR